MKLGRPMSWCVAACAIVMPQVTCADEPVAEKPRLMMENGDYYEGQLAKCDTANELHWHASIADEPLRFPLSTVASAHFPRPRAQPSVEGYCYQLAGGEVFYGQLVSLDGESFEIEAKHFGKLRSPIDQLVRAFRCDEGSGLLYFGPNGLSEWTPGEGKGKWQEAAGCLEAQGAKKLLHSVELPVKACVELELSWQQTPEFVIELTNFCTLESYGQQLVLVRETSESADIGLVGELPNGKGSLRVQLYFDRSAGVCLAVSPEGKRLAEVKLAANDEARATEVATSANEKCAISIQNYGKQLSLDQLIVRQWDGNLPGELETGETGLHLAGGAVRSVKSPQLDAASGDILFVGDDKDEQQRIPLKDVLGFSFPQKVSKSVGTMSVSMADGGRVCGDLRQTAEDHLVVFAPSVSAELRLPLEQVVSLVALTSDSASDLPPSPPGRSGRFEAQGTLSHGVLVDSQAGEQVGQLCWHPRNSINSTKLVPNSSGRIVYRDTPSKPSPTAAESGTPAPTLLGRVFGAFGAAKKPAAEGKYREVIVLRGGDCFPCYLESIDETEVTFKSPFVEITRLPQDQVKAWESMDESLLGDLPADKRERLLTLPRMQRKNPPTHLIESKKGDFLRGRLIELNDKEMVVEVRLQNQKFDRHRISRIVWLEEKDATTDVEQQATEPDSIDNSIQAVHRDGVRLTFSPTGVSEGSIHGLSSTLGECHVDLKNVDQLLIGDAIHQATGEVVSDYWYLRAAPDPRFVTADGSPEGDAPPAGAESDMVGKPAPEFALELLDGTQFRLSEQRNQVVVLDFWATWCGPCIQAMPQVESVVGEFEQQGVKLIAVNMQEDSEAIRSVLERMEIEPTVALDIDGATAEKYAVTAIPQTVVVDKQGNVAALFVGGGPQLVEQLREVLQREVVKP